MNIKDKPLISDRNLENLETVFFSTQNLIDIGLDSVLFNEN